MAGDPVEDEFLPANPVRTGEPEGGEDWAWARPASSNQAAR